MNRPRVIFIATRHARSSLDGEPLLVRLMRQFREQGLTESTVVEGEPDVQALLAGLGRTPGGAIVVEADIAIDFPAGVEIARASRTGESIWFTRGRCRPAQAGGLLKADATGAVKDLRYAPRYDDRFDHHRRLLGVLAIGAKQRPLYQRLLREAAAVASDRHYLTPWADHLPALPCWSYDLVHRRITVCRSLPAEAEPAGAELSLLSS